MGKLTTALLLILTASTILCFWCLFMSSDYCSKESESWFRLYKRFACIAAASLFFVVFIPSKGVLISTLVVNKAVEMKIPKLTEEAVELIFSKIKREVE
jgi:hypothetical protein